MDPNMAVALNFGRHRQAVQAIIDEHIAGYDYLAYVEGRFDEAYDQGKAAGFRQWMESELGSRILEMEEDLNDPDTVYAVMDYQGFLQENPPAESRRGLVEKLMDASNAANHAKLIISGMREGIFTGFRDALGGSVALVAPELSFPEEVIDDMVVVTGLYAYRDATDDELSRYLTHLESEDTRWLYRVFSEIMRDMVVDVCRAISRESAEYFEESALSYLARMDELAHREYELEAGRLAMGFPADPISQVIPIPTDAGETDLMLYQVTYEGLGISLVASYNYYANVIVDRVSSSDLLESVIGGMVGQDKMLLHMEPMDFHGYPAVVARAMSGRGLMIMRCRAYLLGNELIQVLFYGPAYIADHPKIDEYMEGLRLP
jgi:hypothetical protein